MFDYTVRHIAPKSVEFYVRTVQGHRIVRVFLDLPTPRIMAFNESSSERHPGVLWIKEIDILVRQAKEICGME